MKKSTEGIIVEVMVWWLLFLPLSYASLCSQGQQFWNETLEKCVDCSKCPEIGHVVLRPCQIHQDTVCGPLSALDIDWSFLGRPNHRRSQKDGVDSSESAVTHRTIVVSSEEEDKRSHKKPHHKKWKHHHHKKHHHHNKTSSHHHHHHHHRMEWSSSELFPERLNSSESEAVFWERHEKPSSTNRVKPDLRRRKSNSSDTEDMFWEHHEVSSSSSSSRRSEPRRRRPESASQLKEEETNATLLVTPAPFSAAETLVWDWQAVALGLAVFACLLFFVVACVYSVHHARQWRRLKDHFDDFEADVGELSTRLSLLLPALQNETNTECCNNSSQCLYLEKLLARKQQEEEGAERGNVYIDRDVATNGHRG